MDVVSRDWATEEGKTVKKRSREISAITITIAAN